MSIGRSSRLLVLLFVAGCFGSESPPASGDPVRLGRVAFDVPTGWQRSDSRKPGTLVAVWTPDGTDNPRKESITVIEGPPNGQPLDDRTLQKLLSGSQIALAGSKTSRVDPIVIDGGLSGYSINVEFTPQRAKDRYRRYHAVLRDHGRLVHVIYTAREPDPERKALETVLATLHHEEASS